MKRVNLSEIKQKNYVVTLNAEKQTEYWKGGSDWTTDVNDPDVAKVGTDAWFHWADWHVKHGVNVSAMAAPTMYDLIYWPDLGWVVLNFTKKEVTAHRVYFVGTFGDGWYVENEGSVERKLMITLSPTARHVVTVRGHDILKVDMDIAGEPLSSGWTALQIPYHSNLKYQFEFDPTPLEF